MRVCVCVCVYVCLGTRQCVRQYTCVCVIGHSSVCVYLWVCLGGCVFLGARKCECVFVYLGAFVSCARA